MPNFNSDIITAKNQINVSAQMIDGAIVGGLVLLATATYTLAGSEAANDTIQLFDLPQAAVIVPQMCHVTCSQDPGTTLTMHVGDAADVDRFAQGIVLSNGGQVGFCSGTMPAGMATPSQLQMGSRIFATVASAATLTATTKLVFTIAYRIKG